MQSTLQNLSRQRGNGTPPTNGQHRRPNGRSRQLGCHRHQRLAAAVARFGDSVGADLAAIVTAWPSASPECQAATGLLTALAWFRESLNKIATVADSGRTKK